MRGQIIPIIDLRRRLDLIEKLNKERSDTRIMIVNTNGTLVGFIVDEVRKLLHASTEKVEPTPDLVTPEC